MASHETTYLDLAKFCMKEAEDPIHNYQNKKILILAAVAHAAISIAISNEELVKLKKAEYSDLEQTVP